MAAFMGGVDGRVGVFFCHDNVMVMVGQNNRRGLNHGSHCMWVLFVLVVVVGCCCCCCVM